MEEKCLQTSRYFINSFHRTAQFFMYVAVVRFCICFHYITLQKKTSLKIHSAAFMLAGLVRALPTRDHSTKLSVCVDQIKSRFLIY